MLHTHSYNMGMAAGLAWKAAGKEHFYLSDVEVGTPEEEWFLNLLNLTEKFKIGMFLPSSYLEGFYNAFHNPYFVDA